MVLGFISLLLTFGQNYISKVCVPKKYSNTMLPCLPMDQRHGSVDPAAHGPPVPHDQEGGGVDPAALGLPPPHEEGGGGDVAAEGEHHRRLLSYERRFLSTDSGGQGCKVVSNSISTDITY